MLCKTINTYKDYFINYYIKISKKYFVVMLICTVSTAYSGFRQNDYKYPVNISIDSNLSKSQNSRADIAHSIISVLAKASDDYNLNENILSRIGMSYLIFFTSLANHEVTGHGMRALELGSKEIIFSFNIFGGTTFYSPILPFSLYKSSIVSLGGNEANYLLSQKIADNTFLMNDFTIDPITSAAYMFSYGNQLFYAYVLSEQLAGHDLKAHAEYMQLMYGIGSLTTAKIRAKSFIDILDPILLTSVYSLLFGQNVKVPSINLSESITVVPTIRTVLTPYNTIEYKVGGYIKTYDKLMRLSISYGKQSKTIKTNFKNYPELYQIYNYIKDEKYVNSGLLSSVTKNEKVKKHNCYGLELKLFNLLSLNNINIGAVASLWHQPLIDTPDPFRAKAKTGFLFSVDASYQLNETLIITALGLYKTEGYVTGEFYKANNRFALSIRTYL